MNHVARGVLSDSHSSSLQPPGDNLVLRALSAADLNDIAPHLEPLALPVPFLLHDQAVPVEFVYFLNAGVGSIVSQFPNGGSVETGIIGKEGFFGGPLLAGVDSAPTRAFIQVGGNGFRMRKEMFLEQVRQSRAFEHVLQRAVYLELVQGRQIAACNATHEIVERLARWLLMCQDRVQNHSLTLTHEFLGLMLGTRRSSVTLAAGTLQEAGIIRYTRGVIHVINREELEHASCPCYGTLANEYERVIGLAPHRTSTN